MNGRPTWVVALGLVACVGCGGSDGEDVGPTVAYSGTVRELSSSGTTPIEGVELCAMDTPAVGCATTDADGSYTATVPADTTLALRGTKSRFVDAMTFVTTGSEDVAGYDGLILSEVSLALFYGAADFDPPDRTRGTVSIVVEDAAGEGLAGATVEITGTTGAGPAYASESTIDPTLTETSSSGGVAFGHVEPGPVTVHVTAEGLTCGPAGYGWPSDEGSAEGTVMADTVSFFVITCE